MKTADFADLMNSLPPPANAAPIPFLGKVVVLDDDPTGTQTIHGVPVLTRWRKSDLAKELRETGPGFFILTNSRALDSAAAARLAGEIGGNLRAALSASGVSVSLVSRSDSTLRGHYPVETDALIEALGGGFAGTILIPSLLSAGRMTIGDIHYVRSGETVLPVGKTEFARDASFGFRASNLREYVAEKTGGTIASESVVSISIEDLRRGEPDAVAAKLLRMPDGGAAVVNAADLTDLHAFTRALASGKLRGKRFLFRTAADFVAAFMAISPKPLLDRTELITPNLATGGLLVAGSHVALTSRQLEVLFESNPRLEKLEINVPRLLDSNSRDAEISSCLTRLDSTLESGRSAVLFTSRDVIKGAGHGSNLDVGARISTAIVEIVSKMTVRPRWFVAKGGITSSDIATQALGITRAMVLGQALPSVPVWACGPECKWPGLPYIVFPGNVGGSDALAALVGKLSPARREGEGDEREP